MHGSGVLLGGISLSSLLIATSSWYVLYSMCNRASRLLCCSDFHLSVSSMESTLDLLPCRLQTYLAPLRWTISRVWISFCVQGYHTVEAYSTIGLTSELYAFCFTVVDPMLRLRRRNPSVLFALPHIELMCLVQRRSDEIRQPRYLALSTDTTVAIFDWIWFPAYC